MSFSGRFHTTKSSRRASEIGFGSLSRQQLLLRLRIRSLGHRGSCASGAFFQGASRFPWCTASKLRNWSSLRSRTSSAGQPTGASEGDAQPVTPALGFPVAGALSMMGDSENTGSAKNKLLHDRAT